MHLHADDAPPYALCEEVYAMVRRFYETQQRLYILTRAQSRGNP